MVWTESPIRIEGYRVRTLVSIRSRVARRVHAREDRKMYPSRENENTKLRKDSRLDPVAETFALRTMLRAPKAAPR